MNNQNSKNNQARQEKIQNEPTSEKNQNKNLNTTQNTITSTNTETNKQTLPIKNFETEQENPLRDQKLKQNKNVDQHKNFDHKQSKKHDIFAGLIIIGVTLLVEILGSLLGGKMRAGRTNPPAYPPEWLFPTMWSVLYVAIGIASFLTYKITTDKNKQTCNMIWYGIHLFFNLFWPLFYFRLDMLIVSCIWLLLMVITSIVLTFKYYKSNLTSGIIFTAYSLWLIYALYLNLAITILNVT